MSLFIDAMACAEDYPDSSVPLARVPRVSLLIVPRPLRRRRSTATGSTSSEWTKFHGSQLNIYSSCDTSLPVLGEVFRLSTPASTDEL